MPPKLVDASSFVVSNPYNFYANNNRQRVNESILDQDHDLRRRIREGEDNSGSESDQDYYDAEDELYSRSEIILKKDFKNISEAEMESCKRAAVEARNNNWRRMRNAGRLSENEESLKQKEEDEKNGITGPVPLPRFGTSQGAAASQNQVTGTFVGGEIITPVQVLTPPFDRNSLKMKTGKIDPEEYF